MKTLRTLTLSLFTLAMLSFGTLAHALLDARAEWSAESASRIEKALQKEDAEERTEIRGDAGATSSGKKTEAGVSADASLRASVRSLGGGSDSNGTATPPGIDRAPGIEKRLEDGKGLPQGILMKLFGKVEGKATTTDKRDKEEKDHDDRNGTTTADVRAPVIFSVSANAGTSTATIRFFTNERTEAEVRFGTTTVRAEQTTVVDAEIGRVHRIELRNLSPDTLYHSTILATDLDGNVKETADFTFRTDALLDTPERDTTPPRILISLALRVTKDSARILWVTNESADTKLYLSTAGAALATGTPAVSETKLTFFHEAEIAGLASGTTYFYMIASTDASGNTTVQSDGTFKTDTE